MSKKVVLPKFVASKLQELQMNERYVIMHSVLLDNRIAEWTEGENNLIRLASAIEYGYKVELTPEEKLLDYYKACEKQRDHYNPENGGMGEIMHFLNKGAAQAVHETLELLGIEVKGINI